MSEEAKDLITYTDEEYYDYLEKNDVRAELINGYMIVDMGQQSPLHQRLSFLLTRCIYDHIRKSGKKVRSVSGDRSAVRQG